jgi:hypothetical protein
MSLGYSYIDWKSPVAPPPLKVNGGLYTGEAATGSWKNYPVLPEPDELSQNLLSANPPPNAEKIPTTYNREGNNTYISPSHKIFDENHPNLLCRK